MNKWILELANQYEISPETVMGVYNSFHDHIWRDGRRIGKKRKNKVFL